VKDSGKDRVAAAVYGHATSDAGKAPAPVA
jgi:hypothetical protein